MGYATHALASGFVSQQHGVILLLYFPSPFFSWLSHFPFLFSALPFLLNFLLRPPPPIPACFPTLFHIVDLFPTGICAKLCATLWHLYVFLL